MLVERSSREGGDKRPTHYADPNKATAVFFEEQTAEAVIEAVQKFERLRFDPKALVRHASQWGVPEFQAKLRRAVGL